MLRKMRGIAEEIQYVLTGKSGNYLVHHLERFSNDKHDIMGENTASFRGLRIPKDHVLRALRAAILNAEKTLGTKKEEFVLTLFETFIRLYTAHRKNYNLTYVMVLFPNVHMQHFMFDGVVGQFTSGC